MIAFSDCPLAPRAKPEAYRVEPAKMDSNCELCRDGWPRLVGTRSGRALHELPEPAPSFTCSHIDPLPPTIHSCHHVEPCSVTQWLVGIGLTIAIIAVLAWPHIGGLFR